MKRREYKTVNKKKKNVKTPLLISLAVILFLSGFGYAYVHNLLNSTNKAEIEKQKENNIKKSSTFQ